MREINAQQITEVVAKLCIDANLKLPKDVKERIEVCREAEDWPAAMNVLDIMVDNCKIAQENEIPICQDTGVACVFLEIGQDVHIIGDLKDAVDEGVRRGYRDGFLRKSVVKDPLDRVNSGDNTPAMLYFDVMPGDCVKITVAPKGFGSENMSQLKMLRPADGVEGVCDFVLRVVDEAGPNPCPPIVVGVGVGGNFDKAPALAKKALLRPLGQPNENEMYAALEDRLLREINALGIGPQGFGGKTTALAVHIEAMPTHIAGLPCAVNINCHVARHASEVI